jgi:type IV secretory pathway TraG/TraD family ATPase VirD4
VATKQKWGREGYAGDWPSDKAVWTIGAFFVALLSVVAICAYRYERVWTPLERFYLAQYLASGTNPIRNSSRYLLLNVVDKKGSRLALDEEVTPITTQSGENTFALTDEAVKAGDARLEWQRGQYDNAKVHAYLAHWIYNDQTFLDLVKPALWGGLGVFVVGLMVAIPKDAARRRERKEGRRLKGPELVTVGEFNRRNRADGVGFVQQERTLKQKLLGKVESLNLPRRIESSHILIMGDSGTGKSALIRKILIDVQDRNEAAIVYDPALEYTPQFYKPERGDAILNPLDARMPYWSPSDELGHDVEAITLAASLFPDRHNEQPFFVQTPRQIFAHLLTFRPTPEELVWWMSHPEEIDRRVKGTEYAAMIDAQSPNQRNGVLGSLNLVANAMKLLPREKETSARWSARTWERRGWLFITSTPETRKRLVPLVSLWLDTLVLRLMNQGKTSPLSVWFVLDELASLQKLPQLHTAITENRKSNNPVVLGFQGRSQLETRYGHEAEAMLSQPATKIFLRTSEPRSAKWISDTIGEQEIERIRESRSSGQYPQTRKSKSYNLEREVRPLVMASEITGLRDLHGYLKSGNEVVRMSFPYIELPEKQPKFIQRVMKTELQEELKAAAAAAGANGGKPEQKLAPQIPPQERKQAQEQQLKRTEPGQQQTFFE